MRVEILILFRRFRSPLPHQPHKFLCRRLNPRASQHIIDMVLERASNRRGGGHISRGATCDDKQRKKICSDVARLLLLHEIRRDVVARVHPSGGELRLAMHYLRRELARMRICFCLELACAGGEDGGGQQHRGRLTS
jgi:hypothetical protein